MLKPSRDKPVSAVPKIIIIILIISFAAQLGWHNYAATKQLHRQHLPSAPPVENLQLLSLAEPEILARGLMLWLQSFDNQPGIAISFNDLDYKQLIRWLATISLLDQQSQYPLFSAAYIYSNVNNQQKQRQIYNFIEQRFNQHPNKYWRWLAHASILAKHKLKDNELALRYAKALRIHATAPSVPNWAKQMEIGILEEKGEYESVRLLIGGLLSENKITDEHELHFLNHRLKQLKNK